MRGGGQTVKDQLSLRSQLHRNEGSKKLEKSRPGAVSSPQRLFARNPCVNIPSSLCQQRASSEPTPGRFREVPLRSFFDEAPRDMRHLPKQTGNTKQSNKCTGQSVLRRRRRRWFLPAAEVCPHKPPRIMRLTGTASEATGPPASTPRTTVDGGMGC